MNENSYGTLKLNVFDRFVNWYNGLEFSLGNVAASLLSISTPVIPAMLTYTNTQKYLLFTQGQALISALVAEGLGFASLSTAIMFWMNERERRRSNDTATPSQIASMLLAIVAFVFYLTVIVSVNVLLEREFDASGNLINGIEVTARAALSLLVIPGGMIYSLRSQFYGSRKRRIESVRAQIDARAAEQRAELELEMDRKRMQAEIRRENQKAKHELEMERLRVQGGVHERRSQGEQRSGNGFVNTGGKTQIEEGMEYLEEIDPGWVMLDQLPSARDLANELRSVHGRKFSTSSMTKARERYIENKR